MSFGATAATGVWRDSHKPVVVAVDGSQHNRSAVDWAAREAAAVRSGLVLVTAVPDHVVTTPGFSARRQDQEALDLLADVRAQIRHLVDEHRVATRVVVGDPVEVLLAECAEVRMLVVGKRGLGTFARLMVGSTSIGLAGRSPVPVAIIPAGWDPAPARSRQVVLGVDPSKPDHEAFRLAFSMAGRLGVPLVAVHGWEARTGPAWEGDPVTETAEERRAWTRFNDLLALWQEEHPDVVVRPMRVRKHPAAAILEAAEEAELVVLGRHEAGIFGGFAFGSVARAVLHYAETPVLVVPPQGQETVPAEG